MWSTVVTGGREAGERLTRHPDVAKITLTGGTEAGRSAAIATASRFARVTAELGGKTPIIVFDDIDPVTSPPRARHSPPSSQPASPAWPGPDSWCSAASMTPSWRR